ncbi:hypothetical protein [Dysgonomonas sp. ZJ279]|uniref:hypothetical protein n=1 Tax=Dysgonomonas sp. ZJ279 TaxID=2709796 RepID=UPI0013ED195B|nr:hypothetical protein [Dysgonomonas sp. ZJ279]
MATTDINTIKNWFTRGSKPLAAQFAAWLDSYWHKDEPIPIENIDRLDEVLGNFATTQQLDNTLTEVNRVVGDALTEVNRVVGEALKKLENAASSLQLERRISFGMEDNTMSMFFAEALTIYKIAGINVNTLDLVINNVSQSVAVNQTIDFKIPANALVTFSVTRQTIDNDLFLYLFGKITM